MAPASRIGRGRAQVPYGSRPTEQEEVVQRGMGVKVSTLIRR
jgi:hypothetical protein